MVQVIRIPDVVNGTRVLYLREGGIVSHRKRDCVLRTLPDRDGRVVVDVDGREERVPVAEISA